MSEAAKPDESSIGSTIWSILVVVGIGSGIFSKFFKGPATPPKSELKPAASVAPVPETASNFRPDPSHANPAIPRYSNSSSNHQAQQQQQYAEQAAQLQFLLQAAALQQQAQQYQQSQPSEEYQRFQQAAQQARVCFNCGGAGSYRFVDSYGNLNARQCPKCMGSGKSW